MAQIVRFPTPTDRTWREWEKAIRQCSHESQYAEHVVLHALPRIQEHWAAIFAPITLELPKRPVPGELSKSQAVAIQALLDDSAKLVVVRLEQERVAAFQRLLQVELELSLCQVGSPAA